MISAELQQGIDWLAQRYLCARAAGNSGAQRSSYEVDQPAPTSESAGCYDRRAIGMFRLLGRAAALFGHPLHARQPHIDQAHATVPGDSLPIADPGEGARVSGIAEAAKRIECVRDLLGRRRPPAVRETRRRSGIERALRFERTAICSAASNHYSAASNRPSIAEGRCRRSEFQMVRRGSLRSKAHSSSLAEY